MAARPDLYERVVAAFPAAEPLTGWGMTETCAVGTSLSGAAYAAAPDAVGWFHDVMDHQIVDAVGVPMAPGESGQLQVRGVPVTSGYWQAGAVVSATDAQGWFDTGDLATSDDSGLMRIVGRQKAMVIRGGENISCEEVELAAVRLPGVHEALAYGVPDDRLGEELVLVVSASAGVDERSVRDGLVGRVARFKLPSRVVLTSEALPRTASGKLDRQRARLVVDGS
jgi:acyl-CoA synthetase (AMP-forming)/AMP-acid ligase II